MIRLEENRQRVLFVIPSLAGGGAERVAVQVLNALAGDRWDRSCFAERVGPFGRRGARHHARVGGRPLAGLTVACVASFIQGDRTWLWRFSYGPP
jgi:hypothetical protein